MRTLKQGLPEMVLFLLTLFILLNITALPLVEEIPEGAQENFLPTAFAYFLLGFMPGLYVMIKRVSSQGLGLNFRLLIVPGIILLYFSLLPYLVSVYGFNLPGSTLNVDLMFTSKIAALWLGSLVCRSLGPSVLDHKVVTYLRPPYQL